MSRPCGKTGVRGRRTGNTGVRLLRAGISGRNTGIPFLFWVIVFMLVYCIAAAAGTGGKVYVGADVDLEPSESRTESSVTFSKTTGPVRSMYVEGDTSQNHKQDSGKTPVVVELPLDGSRGLAKPRQ